MPLPAFHPPLGHIRSKSMLTPSSIRSITTAFRLIPRFLTCRSAITLKAVGIAQLVVPPTQLHPYFVGSNCTLWSMARNLQRQSQFASRPFALSSQRIADFKRSVSCPTAIKLRTARDVVQQPSASSPMKAGQLPSLFCKSSMAWPPQFGGGGGGGSGGWIPE